MEEGKKTRPLSLPSSTHVSTVDSTVPLFQQPLLSPQCRDRVRRTRTDCRWRRRAVLDSTGGVEHTRSSTSVPLTVFDGWDRKHGNLRNFDKRVQMKLKRNHWKIIFVWVTLEIGLSKTWPPDTFSLCYEPYIFLPQRSTLNIIWSLFENYSWRPSFTTRLMYESGNSEDSTDSTVSLTPPSNNLRSLGLCKDLLPYLP